MNTKQLECVINCDSIMKNNVLGVYARNQIPKHIVTFPCGFIVNTDNSDLAGTHWLAFYFQSKDKSEFFDSYGHSPDYFNFIASAYNDKRVQSNTSDVCGQYCLYYLMNRCRGKSMKSTLNQFGDDYNKNDAFVNNFICRTFPYCFHVKGKQKCCAEINVVNKK